MSGCASSCAVSEKGLSSNRDRPSRTRLAWEPICRVSSVAGDTRNPGRNSSRWGETAVMPPVPRSSRLVVVATAVPAGALPGPASVVVVAIVGACVVVMLRVELATQSSLPSAEAVSAPNQHTQV